MKKKKRNRSHHLQATPASSYQPLTDTEARSMREEMKRDFQKSKIFGVKGPIIVDSGKEKMSEVLIDFARPFLDKYGNEIGTIDKIIALAVVGWNMALVTPSEKRAVVADVLRTLPASQRPPAEGLLRMMEERKRRHFNENKRFIVNYKVKDSGHSFNVFVASTPAPDQMAAIRKKSGKLASVDSEEEEPGGTEARGSDKPGVDAILEQNTASPQEKTSAMRRSGKFRSMLSKLIAYCVSRRGK